MLLSSVLGLLAGVLSAIRQFSWVTDLLHLLFYWVSQCHLLDRLIDDYAFSVQLQWFPASGMYDIWQGGGLSDLLHHLVLPAVTLSLVATG